MKMNFKENKNQVSVIVPIYNVQNYLDRCIESIVTQTFKNLEIILVNDGSTDNSWKICKKWSYKDKRIKIYNKSNCGLSSARNFGIEHAHGKYIGFVDSDDYVEPTMFDELYKQIVNYNAGIACGGYFLIDSTSKKKKEVNTLKSPHFFNSHDAIKKLLTDSCIGQSAWGKLYRKELFNQVKFPVGEINEDLPIMPKLFDEAKRIVHIGKPIYNYVKRNNSITTSRYSMQHKVVYNHLVSIYSYLLENHPDLISSYHVLEYEYLLYELSAIDSVKENKDKFFNLKIKYKKMFDSDFKVMLLSPDVSNYLKIKVILYKLKIFNLVKNIFR